ASLPPLAAVSVCREWKCLWAAPSCSRGWCGWCFLARAAPAARAPSHSPRPSAPPREASRRVQLLPVRLLSPQHGAERAEHLIELRRLDDERRGERHHIPALARQHTPPEALHEHVEG